MEIIRYFCSVKKIKRLFKTIFNTILLFFALLTTSDAKAQNVESADSLLSQMDSVHISLLTCSPGQQIWSLYGHTAIRYEDRAHDTDLAVNYGMFSFGQKNFILKFVFGRTDYEMGIFPFSMFMMDYARQGRSVIQQELCLSAQEKLAITQALAENNLPQNRVYRYNFFYDNCTTRARDMLVDHLSGRVEYAAEDNARVSFREMIHQWNGDHRWMRFGKDLLLGLKADSPTDYTLQQFLPDSLRKDFDRAMVADASGKKHKLVLSTEEILKVNTANIRSENGFWDSLWGYVTPTLFFSLVLLLTAFISFFEYRRKKILWLYDVTLLTLDGLAGIALLLMVFSEHPTVQANLQILLLNPLSIIFAYAVGSNSIKGRLHRYWHLLAICCLLFVAGAIFQHYAEGMILLACSLLVRYIVNRKVNTQ